MLPHRKRRRARQTDRQTDEQTDRRTDGPNAYFMALALICVIHSFVTPLIL